MIKVNAMSQAQLIKLLLDGTHTCTELAEATGLHYVTVLHYCRELHKAGAAHIHMWEKDSRGRDLLKVYKLGQGKIGTRCYRLCSIWAFRSFPWIRKAK